MFNMLFFRALLAFLVLPGLVAGLVPVLILSGQPGVGRGPCWAWVLLGAGLAVLLACVREFYVAGKGTLAPWQPPRRLVTTGLYRFSRNPMYVGVLLVVGGWALAAGSAVLGWYAAFLAAGFHLRVLFYEEPVLKKMFGPEWERYRAQTRRWL